MASRLMLRFAAPAGLALALTVMPAVAADISTPVRERVVAAARMASSAIRHRVPPATRNALFRDWQRRVSAIRSNPECSGVWCGRQFVLIVGVAY
jgi:hypothetical protein